MLKRKSGLCIACLAIMGSLTVTGLRAQSAAPPTTYSVTQVNGMFGAPVAVQVYRDGSKAVVDRRNLRTHYDLQAHTNYTWDVTNPSKGCSSGTYSGDWGDPFALSAEADEMTKSNAKQLGDETINGIVTKVVEAVDPKTNMKVKVWQEPKYGLVIKADMTPPGGATTTIMEVKQFRAVKPDSGLFALPEACVKDGPLVQVPTPEERVAGETGGNAADFVDATMPPGSPNSCTILFRPVRAGSMQPLSNFQVALDLNYDMEHPAHYVMGTSPSGRTVFSGGSLKEYTAQMQNGVLRVENVPDHFDVEMTFAGGNAGASSALIYRHCAGPQTVLLFVVKNPDKVSDGADWMWVKSGKFATTSGR